MTIAISVENVSKSYRLGAIGGGTLANDLNRWWARLRGQPDPLLKIGQEDYGNQRGEHIWAMRDVSFTVRQGEAVGIIGRNGAGKSTLLKILSRVTAPTSGVVKAKGRIASLLEVGTGFHPELTGRENIYLNGTIMGMSRVEVARKFDEIVDFSGVEKFIDTPVKRYSSGMYVRLAFAVAAHLEPDVLIVDEVLAVGDAEFQKKCLGKMNDVAHKEGRTILFVSHNMSAITGLCQSAILLDKGKVVDIGDAVETVSKYLSMGVNGISEITWPFELAPSNEIVSLLGVRACNEESLVLSSFDIRKAINIEIEYQLKKTGFWFTPAILVKNEMGIVLFNSAAQITSSWEDAANEPGFYKSICQIPGNFLAEGAFIIQVTFWGFSRPPQKGIVVEEAIRFNVHDNIEGDSVRGNMTGYYPGVVRPMLQWTTCKK